MKTKKSNQNRVKAKSLSASNVRIINAVAIAIFVVISFWLLAVDGANYLRKIDMLSIFISSNDFFAECMALPGGLLTWMSCYLTQTFLYPWLGAAIYVVLLLSIVFVAIKAFNLSYRWMPMILLLPMVALYALLDLGYLIFSLKTPGFAFNLPLGLLITEVIVWGYGNLKNVVLQSCAVLLIAVLGYALFGFYGLLAATAGCVYALVSMVQAKYWMSILPIVLGVVCVYLVPQLWLKIVGGDLSIAYMYRPTLPKFFADESDMWLPYYVCFSLIILLSIRAAVRSTSSTPSSKMYICGAAVGLASVIAIVPLRNNDRNFRLTLDLDHAIWQSDYYSALEIASKNQDFVPTRINVMLKDIALLRTGRLADNMFNFRNGSAEYETTRALRAPHDVASRMISYHTGQNNYAYRWAMEYKVEYGTSVEQLKFMVKTALLNGDYAVAKKCLDNLSLTTFHGAWAKDYYKYIDDPQLISQNEEFSQILPLIHDDDIFINDGGRLEGYIWGNLSSTVADNVELLKLTMMGALITQDMMSFVEKLPKYASMVDHLPIHIQEAVLAWSLINDDFDISEYKIDSNISQRFQQFLNAVKLCNGLSDEARKEMMAPTFGDTFWYYYLYVSNLKIV